MELTHYGYLIVVVGMLIFYLFLRKLLHLPSLGSYKQLLLFFSLTYITNFLWDNFAVSHKHWEYKNMIGIYIGYSPIENILFAIVFPLAIATIYQIISKLFTSSK